LKSSCGAQEVETSLNVLFPSPKKSLFLTKPLLSGSGISVYRYIQRRRLQGDIEAVSKKLRKVELFLTAFRNDPTKKAEVEKLIDAVFAAVEKKDAGALKSSYNDLVTKSQIKKLINPGYPVPKGSRIVDTSSSIGGTGKLVAQGKFEATRD
jgi:hypothetical protein